MEWQQVIDNPFLQDLPFKIELNKWGKILMSPANNNHGNLQYKVGHRIHSTKRSGEIIIECSIKTPEGYQLKAGQKRRLGWVSLLSVARQRNPTECDINRWVTLFRYAQ